MFRKAVACIRPAVARVHQQMRTDHAPVAGLGGLALNLLRLGWRARRLGGASALAELSGHMLASQGLLGTCLPAQAYGTLPRHRADVYLPPATRARPARGWPVVVFFHGGSWQTGSRQEHAFVGWSLAAQGAVVVVADYRLHPETGYPGFLEDSARAVVWARRQLPHWDADPERFHLMGHSAGAYNAAMLALDARWLEAQGGTPAWLAGWIGLAGPYNFWPVTVPELKPVFAGADVGADCQPVAHVHREAPPSWLLTAPNDRWVSPDLNSRALHRRLLAAGARSEWLTVPRTGHISLLACLAPPLQGWAPVMPRVWQALQGQVWAEAQTSTVNSGSQPSVSPLWE